MLLSDVDPPKVAGAEIRDRVNDSSSNLDDLSYYHYEYGEDDYENIYFIDDEVVWRKF